MMSIKFERSKANAPKYLHVFKVKCLGHIFTTHVHKYPYLLGIVKITQTVLKCGRSL